MCLQRIYMYSHANCITCIIFILVCCKYIYMVYMWVFMHVSPDCMFLLSLAAHLWYSMHFFRLLKVSQSISLWERERETEEREREREMWTCFWENKCRWETRSLLRGTNLICVYIQIAVSHVCLFLPGAKHSALDHW